MASRLLASSCLLFIALHLVCTPALVRAQFPGDATVHLPDGTTKALSALKVGDSIATVDESGAIKYEPIYVFTHRTAKPSSDFLHIVLKPSAPPPPPTPAENPSTPAETPEEPSEVASEEEEPAVGSDGGSVDPEPSTTGTETTAKPLSPPTDEPSPDAIFISLDVAPRHFVHASAEHDAEFGSPTKQLIWAADVKPGYTLWVTEGATPVAYSVISVDPVTKAGLFKPCTLGGSLLVNNVLVSAHGEWMFDKIVPKEYLPLVYQGFLAPLRGVYHAFGAEKIETAHQQVAQAKPNTALGTFRDLVSWNVQDHTEL